MQKVVAKPMDVDQETPHSSEASDSDYELLCQVLNEESIGKSEKPKIVRDRAYFAAAARRSRERKKQIKQLEARNQALEQELQELKQQHAQLQKSLRDIISTQDHPLHQEATLFNENQELTTEVKWHRNLRKRFLEVYEQVKEELPERESSSSAPNSKPSVDNEDK